MTPPQHPGRPDWRDRMNPPPAPPGRRPPPPRRPEPQGRPEPPTEKLRPRPANGGPTQRIPRPPSPADVRPTQQLWRRPPPPPGQPPPPPPAAPGKPRRRRWLNGKSIALIVVIVVALLAGGLAAGELYARSRADSILTAVAECVVEDGATISFGVNPPFLWQHLTGDYTNISVTTAGNRVQSADGMTAEVTLEDVRLAETADSKGTIGALDATLTWTSAGVKDTVAENLPGVGNLVTAVTTNPDDGTIVLEAGDNSVTAKPTVTDGDLNLDVLDVRGPLPRDAVQGALDELTTKLNDNYPLGIRADSVEVTETGVIGKFSSRDAAIPKEDANPCFARL